MPSIHLCSVTLLVALTAAPRTAAAQSAEHAGDEHGGQSAEQSGNEHPGGHMGMSMRRHRYAMRNGIPDEHTSKANPLQPTEANSTAGEKLYQSNCAACHGPSGQGDGPAVANLDPHPTNIARFVDMPMASDGYLYWTIAEGGEPVGSAMPAFGDGLSEDEIGRIATYGIAEPIGDCRSRLRATCVTGCVVRLKSDLRRRTYDVGPTTSDLRRRTYKSFFDGNMMLLRSSLGAISFRCPS